MLTRIGDQLHVTSGITNHPDVFETTRGSSVHVHRSSIAPSRPSHQTTFHPVSRSHGVRNWMKVLCFCSSARLGLPFYSSFSGTQRRRYGIHIAGFHVWPPSLTISHRRREPFVALMEEFLAAVPLAVEVQALW
ncbi:hypothetical protein BDW67DRAFT_167429 [Aspergillus spinulosporus]